MRTSVTHLAAEAVRIEGRGIQRCLICGEKLRDTKGMMVPACDDRKEQDVSETHKAYVVSCWDDDHGVEVIFATSSNAARQRHSGVNCDCGYINLRARRRPELDQYAATGITLRQLVEEHEWYALCSECEKHLHHDDGASFIWCDGGERVFCGRTCLDKFAAFWTGHPNCPEWLAAALASSTPAEAGR